MPTSDWSSSLNCSFIFPSQFIFSYLLLISTKASRELKKNWSWKQTSYGHSFWCNYWGWNLRAHPILLCTSVDLHPYLVSAKLLFFFLFWILTFIELFDFSFDSHLTFFYKAITISDNVTVLLTVIVLTGIRWGRHLRKQLSLKVDLDLLTLRTTGLNFRRAKIETGTSI